MSVTVRVSQKTHELLLRLAANSDKTITALIDEAVTDLKRKKFWYEFNKACNANPDLIGGIEIDA